MKASTIIPLHGQTHQPSALPPSSFFSSEEWEVPFEEISDLQWVGSGAQGAVFLGKLHGQEVAVKKVRNIKETDIKHLRKLKHPNIITFKSVEMISWFIRPFELSVLMLFDMYVKMRESTICCITKSVSLIMIS